MKRKIFPLQARGKSGPGREERGRTQNGKLFENNAHVRVGLFQFDHGREGFAAISAPVVEKLDHGDISLWISSHRRARALGQLPKALPQPLFSLGGPDGYLRYLQIQAIDAKDASIIYVPTEGGLPLLESSRLAPRAEGGN